MIHYFNGADEIIEESPKGNPSWSSVKKYAKVVTGFGSGNTPEYDSPVNNPDWDSNAQLSAKKTELRVTRDEKLSEVDYIFIRHNEELKLIEEGASGGTLTIDNDKYVEFLEYKRDLRDLINNITTWQDIIDLEWPAVPTI